MEIYAAPIVRIDGIIVYNIACAEEKERYSILMVRMDVVVGYRVSLGTSGEMYTTPIVSIDGIVVYIVVCAGSTR